MVRTMVRVTFAVLLLQLAVISALAQNVVRAEVPFTFMAGSKEMPAGAYEFSVTPNNVLRVRGNKGAEAIVPILTRVSARPDAPVLYFDKAEDKSYLAEIYFPGADGVHLQGAPGKHTHTKVAVK
jgi:hypothetical protein